MSIKVDRYSNPPFDARIYSVSGLEVSKNDPDGMTWSLQRGYMIQDKGLGNVQWAVRFLYNPSVIQVSHQTDVASSTSVTPQNYRNPLDKGDWNVPLSASVSFNLLFDRTYELWDTDKPEVNGYDWTTSSSMVGVRADVDALYRVVGIYQPGTIRTSQNTPGGGRTKPGPPVLTDNGDLGPMPLTPVTVYFGGKNSLSYRGYVSGLDVQWTHFSQLMVPMRCTIGVSMNLMTKNSWDSDYDGVESDKDE